MRFAQTATILPLAALVACGAPEAPREEGSTEPAAVDQTPSKDTETMPTAPGEGLFATFTTSKGTIICKLEMEKAPMTVANFVGLAEGKVNNTFRKAGEPYYDGVIFHRVITGFMIQGGDPQGTGAGGPGYDFDDELSRTERYTIGTLAMANRGPDTNGSQFFIVTGQQAANLPPSYTVFGHVTEGQEVADAISQVPRDPRDRPLEEVKIISVRIERRGDAAKAFSAPDVLKKYADKFRAG